MMFADTPAAASAAAATAAAAAAACTAAAGIYSINYLLSGPSTSFPSPLSGPVSLAALQLAIRQSMGLTADYPLSSITVSVTSAPRLLRSPSANTTRGLLQASDGESPAAAAAAQRASVATVLMKSGVADLPQGSLPASFGFQTLPSPVLFKPDEPYGPGITAQASDEIGNVINLIGEAFGFMSQTQQIAVCLGNTE
jgi:hypothetical protein